MQARDEIIRQQRWQLAKARALGVLRKGRHIQDPETGLMMGSEPGPDTGGSGGGGASSRWSGRNTLADFEAARIDIGGSYGSDEAVEEFLDKWNEQVDMPPGEFKEKFTSGMNSEMQLSYDGLNGFNVTGSLHDKDGEQIAEFEAFFDPEERTADAGNLEFNRSFQDAGLAKQYVLGQMNTFRELGIRRVDLTAGREVGGYAWARYGLTPTVASWGELQPVLRERLRILGMTYDQAVIPKLRELIDNGNPRAIWGIADSAQGKDLLLGTVWKGQVNFQDKESMQRFKAYMARTPGTQKTLMNVRRKQNSERSEGFLDDALHDTIIAEGDEEEARKASLAVMLELGISQEDAEALLGIKPKWLTGLLAKYHGENPDERDEQGRFAPSGSGGGGDGAAEKPSSEPSQGAGYQQANAGAKSVWGSGGKAWVDHKMRYDSQTGSSIPTDEIINYHVGYERSARQHGGIEAGRTSRPTTEKGRSDKGYKEAFQDALKNERNPARQEKIKQVINSFPRQKYHGENPDERDEQGRFAPTGSGGGGGAEPSPAANSLHAGWKPWKNSPRSRREGYSAPLGKGGTITVVNHGLTERDRHPRDPPDWQPIPDWRWEVQFRGNDPVMDRMWDRGIHGWRHPTKEAAFADAERKYKDTERKLAERPKWLTDLLEKDAQVLQSIVHSDNVSDAGAAAKTAKKTATNQKYLEEWWRDKQAQIIAKQRHEVARGRALIVLDKGRHIQDPETGLMMGSEPGSDTGGSSAGTVKPASSGRQLNDKETNALSDYVGIAYRRVNPALRKGMEKSLNTKDKQTLRTMDSVLKNEFTAEDQVVYRGVGENSNERFGSLQVGNEIVDKAFMSTTRSEDVAKRFERSGEGVMRINVPKGTRAAYLPDFEPSASSVVTIGVKSEEELLIARGARLRYDGTTNDQGKVFYNFTLQKPSR